MSMLPRYLTVPKFVANGKQSNTPIKTIIGSDSVARHVDRYEPTAIVVSRPPPFINGNTRVYYHSTAYYCGADILVTIKNDPTKTQKFVVFQQTV
mmetsp:Transcript_8236/g.9130  ORF Transcript_8236/g.9130 Transcript_8236/m.9130 type:complete len:95 (-) Transcript_8236:147-431(-)